MTKRVLISGYIGFSNFGDDTIFTLLTQHLKTKNVNICALAYHPSRAQKRFKVEAVNYKNPFEILLQIIRCDYLISGGGSLLQNVTSNFSLLYYISIILIAKLMFKKVIIFAQGIGPINGFIWKNLVRLTLSMCDLITLRDVESKNMLDGWKIKSDIVNDPVWDLPILPYNNKGYVGVQLRHYSNMHPDFLKTLAKYITNRFSDRKIIIYIFQKNEDIPVAKEFLQELKRICPNIECTINYNNTAKSIVQEFSNLEYLFAMRFHACLLGLKYGLRVFALSYDIKVENLANEYKLNCTKVSSSPDEILAKLDLFTIPQDNEYTRKTPAFDWSIIDDYLTK